MHAKFRGKWLTRGFSAIHSVTNEANHVKCKTLMQDSWLLKIFEIGQRVRSCGATLYQEVEIFFCNFGAAFWLAWNFARSSRPTCPSSLPNFIWNLANFMWNLATSRPCGAKKLIFGLLVNLIPAVCRFAARCLVAAGKEVMDFFLFKNISRITSSCDRICMHLLTYVCILSYNICSKTGPSIL